MNPKSVIIIFLCIVSVFCHGTTRGIDDRNRDIESHMKGEVDITRMSEDELRFIFFKSHDTDADIRLDGNELVQSILHFQAEWSVHNGEESEVFEDFELTMVVDTIMASNDQNGDGFIDYREFVAGPGIFIH